MNFSEYDRLYFPSPLPCPVALREVTLAIGETHRTLFCGEGLNDCLFVFT